MKSMKPAMLVAFVVMTMIPLISAASLVAIPFEIVGNMFEAIGEVFSGPDDKEALVEFVKQSLLVTDTREALNEHYAPYRNVEGAEIPLHYFVVVQYLMGWSIDEADPERIEQMASAALTDARRVATVEEYVDELLMDDPFRSIINATSGTVVEMINAVGDLDSIAILDEDIKAQFYDQFIYPLETRYPVSAEIGWYDPWNTGTLKRHEGIDVAAPEGTPIYAVYDGVIVMTSNEVSSSARGNYVILSLGDGVTVRYYHMRDLPLVKTGETVRGGEVIGYVGSTGDSTGPHLHLEVRVDGEAINPRELIYFD